MKLETNPVLRDIRKPKICLWASLGTGSTAETIAVAGFDWRLTDMDHASTDFSGVVPQLQIIVAF